MDSNEKRNNQSSQGQVVFLNSNSPNKCGATVANALRLISRTALAAVKTDLGQVGVLRITFKTNQ